MLRCLCALLGNVFSRAVCRAASPATFLLAVARHIRLLSLMAFRSSDPACEWSLNHFCGGPIVGMLLTRTSGLRVRPRAFRSSDPASQALLGGPRHLCSLQGPRFCAHHDWIRHDSCQTSVQITASVLPSWAAQGICAHHLDSCQTMVQITAWPRVDHSRAKRGISFRPVKNPDPDPDRSRSRSSSKIDGGRQFFLGAVPQAVLQGGFVRGSLLGVCAAGYAAGWFCEKQLSGGPCRR